MGLVIAISGLHGTGKSTYARKIADEFALRHVSVGELFRQLALDRKLSITELSLEAERNDDIDLLLDTRTKKEIRDGRVVVDGLLAGWMAKEHSALKIYLSTPYDVRIRRIASRENVPYAEAERITNARECSEKERFKKQYDIDIDCLSIYDLVLNTGLFTVESNYELIKCLVREYVKLCEGG
jgi:cytidylate kinase